ncbi:MAG: hypothetical protein A3D92_05965 [Bacteroidetes bacterium RIFCSPHIGHO2_02_FULL_44_7]|nr:MAG: hypothetical protein A3D92_05965 [Bacteroidetes bacterium RIFCSPHIGHO2_02_FULL_44_7]
MADSTNNDTKPNKRSKLRKVFRISYFTMIHVLAIFALFLIATALAVHFKWTNQSGTTDVNNRYFEELAEEYGQDQDMDSIQLDQHQDAFFQRLGVLAKYKPIDARNIYMAYENSHDVIIGLRMLDAASLMLKENAEYQRDLKELKKFRNGRKKSVYEWSNYKVWDEFCLAVLRDSAAIDSASRISGVESRLIVMCLVGEQVRMFNSGRERFKQYVYPFSRVMLANNRGYGVTSILEHTALKIESNLTNKKSPFYPGDYFAKCLNYNDSFPSLVVDSIEAHKHKTIQRLIQGGDHFYSYLYTGFLLRQYYAQWIRAGYDISNRPEVLGTLFNIGFHKSVPKAKPEAGGSAFNVGGKDYTFGGLCFEFYYSGAMIKEFPITRKAFIPIKELEKKNEKYLETIEKLMAGDSLAVE